MLIMGSREKGKPGSCKATEDPAHRVNQRAGAERPGLNSLEKPQVQGEVIAISRPFQFRQHVAPIAALRPIPIRKGRLIAMVKDGPLTSTTTGIDANCKPNSASSFAEVRDTPCCPKITR